MTEPAPAPPPLLVGVDFSEGALAALLEGRRLAARMRLPVEVVHVHERLPSESRPEDPAVDRWLAQADLARDRLQIARGLPWVELARAAVAARAFAIVIGSHGCSGVQPVELGSTAARLGLVAPCPVIVVGPQARELAIASARLELLRLAWKC